MDVELSREVERFPIDGDWKPSACQHWYKSIVDYGPMSGDSSVVYASDDAGRR